MKKIMETIVFSGYSVQDLLIGAAAGMVLLMVGRIILKALKGKDSDKFVQPVECFSCGWRGKVSRYAGRCPKCNQPLGDRKAGRGR